MKRVLTIALISAALLLCTHRNADAMIEYCPASLSIAPVGDKSPSGIYGFDLTALGPRTVNTAILAFDTNSGWFVAGVQNVPLREKDHRYIGSFNSFTREDYVSPVLYVQFPQSLTLKHAWVYAAAATNDSFGWNAQGEVACDPPGSAFATRDSRFEPVDIRMDPRDKDHLSTPPTATSVVLSATSSKPLEFANCAKPFRYATLRIASEVDYPQIGSWVQPPKSTSRVTVAIDADGKVRDAWIWGPSGYAAFDKATLRAAKASIYVGARSYCRSVPGLYLFDVTFDPNS